MRSSRRILLAGALPGLALAALASSPAVASEVQHRPTIKLGRSREEDLEALRKVSLRPSPTPKKGKPTKAEKKAAKRARTRGVPACPMCEAQPGQEHAPACPRHPSDPMEVRTSSGGNDGR